MPGAPVLEAETVTLRTIEEEDVPFIRDGVNHPSVRRRVGQSLPTNLFQERRYFEESSQSLDTVQLLATVEDERAGVVELDPIDRESGTATFAIWLVEEYRGSGIGRESTELLTGYAFDELRLHKVTAEAYAFNDDSRALLERVGFVEEGVGREDSFVGGEYVDTHYFGLLEDEWRGA